MLRLMLVLVVALLPALAPRSPGASRLGPPGGGGGEAPGQQPARVSRVDQQLARWGSRDAAEDHEAPFWPAPSGASAQVCGWPAAG